jgi:hypothetical protein
MLNPPKFFCTAIVVGSGTAVIWQHMAIGAPGWRILILSLAFGAMVAFVENRIGNRTSNTSVKIDN